MKFRVARIVILVCSFGLSSWAWKLHDPVVVGQTFMTGALDPRSGSNAWALTSHGISENLFTVNDKGDIVPQVAKSVTRVSDLVWDVTLNSGHKFSDGTEVNAQHVANCLAELNEKNPSAKSSLGTMKVTTRDNLTVRIESERGTHVMDAVLAEWVFALYFVDANNNFVFTGPYAVETFIAGDHIDLVPNPYYPQAYERPLIVIKKFADGHALAQAVKDKKVDVAFHLPIDTLTDLRATEDVHVRSFEVGYHYMAFHNLRRPNMQDVKVRQAIDLAIDRSALSQALAGGRATRSLFPDYSPYFSDTSETHGQKSKAEALLDEAGWTLDDTTGNRTKSGEALTIKLVAYPHRPGLVIMQPLIEQALTDLGISVDKVLTGDEWSETQGIIDTGDFDLLMWAQNTLPAGDPAWFLNAFFRTDQGNNHAGFSSTNVDSLLDVLSNADEHTARVAATAEVHAAILAEVPVSNLVTPSWHVGLSDRVAHYKPYGSDYYVIRADLFVTENGSPGPLKLSKAVTILQLHDPVVVGQTFMTGALDPRSGSNAWALTSHGISENLFTVNDKGDIVPQVAKSVTRVSDLVWDVTLNSGHKFSDGTEVNAQHVANCLAELNEKNPSAKSSLGTMKVTTRDNLTVRIESERGTHVMDAVLAEWVFALYFVDANNNFVFTGPYAVETFIAGDHIDLVPNPYYPQAYERPLIVIKKFADGHALAQAVKDKKVDVAFHLPIDTLTDLRATEDVHVRSFEVGYHYMAFHNLRRPNMQDVKVRQAIDLAIDRSALSQALAGGRATRSLFPDYSPYFSDTSETHGQKSKAEALLDEAGWTLDDTTGNRTKSGEALTIKLVAYPHRPGLVIMQPLIEQALTDLGISVDKVLTGDEWSETQGIIDTGDFDLLMWAQNTLPAGDPAWFLNAFFRTDQGNNHAGFSSTNVDSLLDVLSNADEHTARVAATAEVHAAILAEVPVSNLVTPSWHVGLSDRVAHYKPYGSDYYVIRADLFVTAPSLPTKPTPTTTIAPNAAPTTTTEAPPTAASTTTTEAPPTATSTTTTAAKATTATKIGMTTAPEMSSSVRVSSLAFAAGATVVALIH